MDRPDQSMNVIFAPCAGGRGSAIPESFARPIDFGMRQTIETTSWVFGLLELFRISAPIKIVLNDRGRLPGRRTYPLCRSMAGFRSHFRPDAGFDGLKWSTHVILAEVRSALLGVGGLQRTTFTTSEAERRSTIARIVIAPRRIRS